jgi:hypothetical protein
VGITNKPPVLNEVEILDGVIKLYTENPEAFVQGRIGFVTPTGKVECCTIGGVSYAAGLYNGFEGRFRTMMYPHKTRIKRAYPARNVLGFIAKALGSKNEEASVLNNQFTVMRWSDKNGTTVEDVVKVLKKARRLAAKALKS